jgi:translation initiation factor 5A
LSIKKTSAKSLKPGSYVVIDGEPCRVTSIEKSKPGKHGSAKANITAIGFFDNRKRNVIMPADRMVDVPIIDKRSATVIAEMGERYTLMDTETYETYDIKKPQDPEISSKMDLNKEVEVWELMGERVITRVKS